MKTGAGKKENESKESSDKDRIYEGIHDRFIQCVDYLIDGNHVKNHKQFAENVLGIVHTQWINARDQQSKYKVQMHWVVKLVEYGRFNLEWIIMGRGSMFGPSGLAGLDTNLDLKQCQQQRDAYKKYAEGLEIANKGLQGQLSALQELRGGGDVRERAAKASAKKVVTVAGRKGPGTSKKGPQKRAR